MSKLVQVNAPDLPDPIFLPWHPTQLELVSNRSGVQGVKSLEGHFACLCREIDFYEAKKNIIIFQK